MENKENNLFDPDAKDDIFGGCMFGGTDFSQENAERTIKSLEKDKPQPAPHEEFIVTSPEVAECANAYRKETGCTAMQAYYHALIEIHGKKFVQNC